MLNYEVNEEAIKKVQEINEKLESESDGKMRTKLMFEQMLRGLHINTFN